MYNAAGKKVQVKRKSKLLATVEDDLVERVQKYKSRRDRTYDNDDSNGEEDDQDDDPSNKSGAIKYVDTKGNTTTLMPNQRFSNYKNVFTNLLDTKPVVTMYSIVSMCISFDSTRAITVTKANDQEYWIKMYDLNNGDLTFEEKVGGSPEQYIKLKEVEQNSSGTAYAAVYNDDGKFRLRTFKKVTRTEEQIEENEFKINEALGLDDYTMCNNDFPDPNIICCFVDDDTIFVALFHNYSRTHYHFLYDAKNKCILENKEPVKEEIECTKKNFPYKCFYNEDKKEIYCFYRQGMAYTISLDPENLHESLSDYRYERMTDLDLGQMVLFQGEALIARSSSRVLFFKQETDKVTKERAWKKYHEIRVRGFIYFIKGNIRIQVTTDELIYFYLINQETFMPELENCMYNYMGCNQMMFGRRVRYGISYKTN